MHTSTKYLKGEGLSQGRNHMGGSGITPGIGYRGRSVREYFSIIDEHVNLIGQQRYTRLQR